MRSARVGVSIAALRVKVLGGGGLLVVCRGVIVHSLFFRCPRKMTCPLKNIFNVSRVKRAWQPASQSWPMESREPEANAGNK